MCFIQRRPIQDSGALSVTSMADRLTHYSSMHPFIHPSIFGSFLASFTSEKGYLAEVERKSQALLKSPQLNFQQLYSVFAEGLYGKTNADIHELCIAANNSHADQFPINNQTVEADLYKGGVFLGCTYGALAMYAIGTILSTVCNLNQISGMSGLLGC